VVVGLKRDRPHKRSEIFSRSSRGIILGYGKVWNTMLLCSKLGKFIDESVGPPIHGRDKLAVGFMYIAYGCHSAV
jgi:hypothetical protein